MGQDMDTITGRIVATRHAGTSGMGNPTFDVAIDTGHGVEILTTAANAGIAYGIGGRVYRDEPHTFDMNKRGRITSARRV